MSPAGLGGCPPDFNPTKLGGRIQWYFFTPSITIYIGKEYMKISEPIAHISDDGRVHTLYDHLTGTANRSEKMAEAFGCGGWSRVAGLWHDLGKYSPEFQHYIRAASGVDAHMEGKPGRVDHSTAGALYAIEQLNVAGRILAYPIAGHHTGLPDWEADKIGNAALKLRLGKTALLNAARAGDIPSDILSHSLPSERPKQGADPALWIRLLFSCVVDADFLDTEAFLEPDKSVARGEALALKWRHVDLLAMEIQVVETAFKLGDGTYVIKEPKTAHSRRSVVVPRSLAVLLRQYRDEQQERCERLGKELSNNDFVFCRPDGRPLDPNHVTRTFIKLVRTQGLPHVRLHDLRHTHATLMLKAGVHPKIVSERLGHANIGITLDTYSHVLPGLQEAAAERFDRLMVGEISGEENSKLGVCKMFATAPENESEPCGIRTHDTLIKSQGLVFAAQQ